MRRAKDVNALTLLTGSPSGFKMGIAMTNPLIEQPLLSDTCPCNSGKPFGSCCGFDFECDCKSHLPAGECCYSLPEKTEK